MLRILIGKTRSFSNRRLIIGVTALAVATVLQTFVASSDVELRNVDGGQNYYYSKFSDSLSDPNFFPLGVLFGSVVANIDKDAGLNLYVLLTADSTNLFSQAENRDLGKRFPNRQLDRKSCSGSPTTLFIVDAWSPAVIRDQPAE